jgi:hypothetical protein
MLLSSRGVFSNISVPSFSAWIHLRRLFEDIPEDKEAFADPCSVAGGTA